MNVYFVGPFRSYRMTDEDILWLARALAGEGGEKTTSRDIHAAIAWGMMNRLLLKRGFAEGSKSYSWMAQWFNQSLSPKWLRDGEACAKADAKTKELYCTEAKFQRREKMRSRTFADLNPAIVQSAQDFAAGNLLPPDVVLALEKWRISDWAAASRPDHPDQRWPHGINVGNNWFFQNDDLVDSEIHVVRADAPPTPEKFEVSKSGTGIATKVVVVAVVGVIAATIWAWWRANH
jgi:hypothetical protein